MLNKIDLNKSNNTTMVLRSLESNISNSLDVSNNDELPDISNNDELMPCARCGTRIRFGI